MRIFEYDADSERIDIFDEKIFFSTVKYLQEKFKREYSVTAGSIVAVYLPTSALTNAVVLALYKMGAVVSNLFSSYGDQALKTRLELLNPDYIISWRSISFKLNKIREIKAESLLSSDIPIVSREDVAITSTPDLAFIHFTSGTTGMPKMVPHSAKDLNGLKISIEKVFDIKAGTNYLCTADFGWVTGFYYGVFMPLISDLNLFIVKNMNGFRLMKALSRFREWNIEVIYTSPSFLNIAYRFFRKYETNIKQVYTVGEKLPIETKKKYLELGYEITDTWWQTELGCISISGRVKAQTSFPLGTMIVQDYIGKPLDFVDIALLNDDSIVPIQSILRMPPAEMTGELLVNRITHPSIMKEYYKADENARKKFIGDYYKTGDLIRLLPETEDPQSYNIQYISRADDIIVIAGELISPDEIESLVMKKFDSISECCAVAADIKHPADTEHPADINHTEGKKIVLFISSDRKSSSADASDGKSSSADGSCASEITQEQIKKAIAQNLMPSMVPYKVVKIGALPKTESGKIKRNELRRMANELIQK